jgi:CheY-like chemotaxis protein
MSYPEQDERDVDRESAPAARGRLVLLAEAVSDPLGRYQTLLEGAGYTVVVVPYDEAATVSRNIHPAIIILRVIDPGISGLGMVRDLRKQAETRDTPLMTLVRFDNAHTREQIVRAGATAILLDPVKASTLLRQLRRLLVRSVASGATGAVTRKPAAYSAASEASRG